MRENIRKSRNLIVYLITNKNRYHQPVVPLINRKSRKPITNQSQFLILTLRLVSVTKCITIRFPPMNSFVVCCLINPHLHRQSRELQVF